jgi:uncharacterized membrane protein YqjE
MPTRAADGTANGGLGGATKQVAEHASAIVRLELELAALELKKKVVALGIGIGLLLGAGLFALYGLGFAFATVAAAFDTFLPHWAALLVTTGVLFGLAGLLGVLGLGRVARGTPPVPQQAIAEAKLTTEALKR